MIINAQLINCMKFFGTVHHIIREAAHRAMFIVLDKIGTCIYMGDPCTRSYKDCDPGLICDQDQSNGENYCKKPSIGNNALPHVFHK